ncbi:hypothetical protein, partial [Accumulibacter sp.]|uniref:hypothetical protein n=1 Tax=Accumulibacter sp. TaxID=2053492 RepID=UPI0028C3F9FF
MRFWKISQPCRLPQVALGLGGVARRLGQMLPGGRLALQVGKGRQVQRAGALISPDQAQVAERNGIAARGTAQAKRGLQGPLVAVSQPLDE